MAKYQAFLFFPLLLLEAASLPVSGVKAVWRNEVKARGLETGMLLAHAAAYLTAAFTVLSPLTALAFMAVHQGLWGVYLGCSFAPNHKGLATATHWTFSANRYSPRAMCAAAGWWTSRSAG